MSRERAFDSFSLLCCAESPSEAQRGTQAEEETGKDQQFRHDDSFDLLLEVDDGRQDGY